MFLGLSVSYSLHCTIALLYYRTTLLLHYRTIAMPSNKRYLVELIIIALIAIAAIAMIVIGAQSSGTVITVEWSTASELNTAGFNLYRGDSKDGPFTRINPELIPASLDPLVGGEYAFIDTNAIAGHIYYYQIEEVETNGATNRPGLYEYTANSSPNPLVLIAGAVVGIAIVGVIAWITRKR